MSHFAIAGTRFKGFCVAQQHENRNLAKKHRKPIKAKRASSSIVQLQTLRKTVAEGGNRNTGSVLNTQPTYTCTGPVCQLLIPPSRTIGSRPRSVMACHRSYFKPSRCMYTLLRHWCRKHATKVVKKTVANPRLPGTTLAGTRHQSISPSGCDLGSAPSLISSPIPVCKARCFCSQMNPP